jgi:hypothetical protein
MDKKLLLSVANFIEFSKQNANPLGEILSSVQSKYYCPFLYDIQKEQLKVFVYNHFYSYYDYPMILPVCSLNGIISFWYEEGFPIYPHESLSDFINLFQTPYLQEKYKQNRQDFLDNAQTVRENREELSDSTFDKSQLNQRILSQRISRLMPEKDPHGKPIHSKYQKEIVNKILKYDDISQISEALYLEGLFFDYRFIKRNKKPEEQDFMDIEHIVNAILFSDIFMTKDRVLNQFIENLRKKQLFSCLPEIKQKFNC